VIVTHLFQLVLGFRESGAEVANLAALRAQIEPMVPGAIGLVAEMHLNEAAATQSNNYYHDGINSVLHVEKRLK
jgi:hypothetical protein